MISKIKKVTSATRFDAMPYGIEFIKDGKLNSHWYSTYEERDKNYDSMMNVYRSTLTTIKNTNGNDNASCPKCGNYNAMLYADYNAMPTDNKFLAKCRDCNFECLVDLTL